MDTKEAIKQQGKEFMSEEKSLMGSIIEGAIQQGYKEGYLNAIVDICTRYADAMPKPMLNALLDDSKRRLEAIQAEINGAKG